MKRIILMIAVLLTANFTFAQLSTGSKPRSFSQSEIYSSLSAQLNVPEPSLTKAIAEDAINDTSFYKPRHFGLVLRVGEDFFAKAQKFSVSGGELYLLKIKAPNAQALNLYSSNFYMPEGTELHLYNANHTKVIGAFSSANNRKDGSFASEFIYGDEMYMEYFQPSNIQQRATIEITEIGYAYRDWEKDYASYGEYGQSGSCNVNVNCSEGDNTRQQQKGVMEIVLKLPNNYIGWCTGSLVNNTSRDLKPYVLTALHCIENITSNLSSYMSQFLFYFNFESTGCQAYSQPTCRTLTGCSEKMEGSSSDCLLVLLNDTVPSSFNAYWNGWTTTTTAPSSGVGIHHPSGDIKKISTYTAAASAVTYSNYASGAHWRVKWVQTSNGYGITEGGSSGSPLFNQDGLIVGTLTGGSSACDVSDSYKMDYYGRMSYHWTSNGSADNQRLKPWLDPLSLGVTQMHGDNYVSVSSLEEVGYQDNTTVYPLPANNELTVVVNGLNEDVKLTLLDMNARELLNGEINAGTTTCKMNVKSLASGSYILRLASKSATWTKKVVIVK